MMLTLGVVAPSGGTGRPTAALHRRRPARNIPSLFGKIRPQGTGHPAPCHHADAHPLLRRGQRAPRRLARFRRRLGQSPSRPRRRHLRRPARPRGPAAGRVRSVRRGACSPRPSGCAASGSIRVTGIVRPRPAGTANANLASGQVELLAREIEVLNRSEPLAVPARRGRQGRDPAQVPLSRPAARRDAAAAAAAHRGHARDARVPRRHGFIDLETPMLTKATPEGARDYLVPSRTQPGQVLRAAAVAADLQAAADDVGLRSLLPDRALLPRRGPARRPSAGVHAARHRDVVPDARRDHATSWKACARAVPRRCSSVVAARSRSRA